MASGDRIKFRGKLTKSLVDAFGELLDDRPNIACSEVVVTFSGPPSQMPVAVRMRLFAALQALTFDIAEAAGKTWAHATTVHVTEGDVDIIHLF